MLQDYGITANDADQLQSLLDAYSAKITAPRTVINRRREATLHLQDCFRKSDELLDTLDRLFLQYRNTSFYATYKSARRVVNLRGSVRKGKKGTVAVAAN